MDLRKLGLTITIENYVEDLADFIDKYNMYELFEKLYGYPFAKWDFRDSDTRVINILLEYVDTEDKIYFSRITTINEEPCIEIIYLSRTKDYSYEEGYNILLSYLKNHSNNLQNDINKKLKEVGL